MTFMYRLRFTLTVGFTKQNFLKVNSNHFPLSTGPILFLLKFLLKSDHWYRDMCEHRKVQAAGLCFQCTYTLSISVHFVHFSSRKNAIVPCHSYDFTVKSLKLGQTESLRMVNLLANWYRKLYIRLQSCFQCLHEQLKGQKEVTSLHKLHIPQCVWTPYESQAACSYNDSSLEKTDQEMSVQNKVTLFPTTNTQISKRNQLVLKNTVLLLCRQNFIAPCIPVQQRSKMMRKKPLIKVIFFILWLTNT